MVPVCFLTRKVASGYLLSVHDEWLMELIEPVARASV
jgi:hypothetical protein